MDRLVVGEVLKPQGIRGELKVKTFTDAPEDVKAFGTVYIDNVPYKILSSQKRDMTSVMWDVTDSTRS